MNENKVIVSNLSISDIPSVYEAYNSLSINSKNKFRPQFLREKKGIVGFFMKFGLISSSIKPLQKVVHAVVPPLFFLAYVAKAIEGEEKKVAGFSYLRIVKRSKEGGFLASLGIFVTEKYQGKGIGKLLMEKLLAEARKNNIREICLTVSPENYAAILLYKKFGFKKSKHSNKELRMYFSFD